MSDPVGQRHTQDNIPSARADRDALRSFIRKYKADHALVGPLSFTELSEHTAAIIAKSGSPDKFVGYVAVLLNNEVWRDSLASIPFSRRLLLLPKCLRDAANCQGEIDEMGLVCRDCGRCPISSLKNEAQRLGYVVLVAEGAGVVISLVQTGQIEGIVGVSCLSTLERIFPCIEAAAVPGAAVPLLRDGCLDSHVDVDWVEELIHLTNTSPTDRLDMEALRSDVESWFSQASIEGLLGAATCQTERLAQDWLAIGGKRWRPFLAACSYQAFQDDPAAPAGNNLRKIALAVECFHKASLIHDDIEDSDKFRYGQRTLHEEYGVPIALNVGDFLLGEGYRLIADTSAPAPQKANMLAAAAAGHRCLCTGQGDELAWMRRPEPLSVERVLDIFRRKTAPAFEVALRLGAVLAATEPAVWEALASFSQALGVAYQIRDDLDDLGGNCGGNGHVDDVRAIRPSLLLAIACEQARGTDKQFMESLWRREVGLADTSDRLRRVLDDLRVEDDARSMLGSFKDQAIQSLRSIHNSKLKRLLRRVVGKIFDDLPAADFGANSGEDS